VLIGYPLVDRARPLNQRVRRFAWRVMDTSMTTYTNATYWFTVDRDDEYNVKMIDSFLGGRAYTKDQVVNRAVISARNMFGQQYWCNPGDCRVVASHYDQAGAKVSITLEGPIGEGWAENIRIPKPLRDVMLLCETGCVVGCCGLDALEISTQSFKDWETMGHGSDLLEALRQIDEILALVASRDGTSSCAFLQYSGTANEWAEMLGEWREAIKSALV